MRTSPRLVATLAMLTAASYGCNQPGNSTAQQKPATDQTSNADQNGKSSVKDSPQTSKPAAVPESDIAVKAQSSAATKAVATTFATAKPTTTAEAIEVINLPSLPRLNEKRVLESSPTYVYYSAIGSIPSADAFYKAELGSKGWKELPELSPATDSYSDRSFEKSGFVVRVSLSVGSIQGEVGVMLANLGNVDVRTLPLVSDAGPLEPTSSPVNATHKTDRTIPEVADEVSRKFIAAGWQPLAEFHENPTDVPHFRSLHFRNQAVRVNVGIIKNPQNPADKTTVFYHAEYLTPFDIPTVDHTKPLKLDTIPGRAAFEVSASRQELVANLQKDSERFGWKLINADKFAAGEISSLPIETKSETYLIARLVESSGKYSAWFEKGVKPVESKSPAEESAAKNTQQSKAESTNSKTAESEAKPSKADAEFSNIQAQVDATIQAELSKALGSIKGAPSTGSMNIAELQAKALELNKAVGNLSDEEDSGEENDNVGRTKSKSNANPFDVPEDNVTLSSTDKAIKSSVGKIKYGDKTYELRNVVAYAVKDDDQTVKCILLSEGKINTDKLTRSLQKEGRPIGGYEVCEFFKPTMDIRVSNNSTMLNAAFDGTSIATNAGDIKADIKLVGGKLVGTVRCEKGIELGGKLMEFEIQINQEVIRPDWNSRNSAEAKKLFADSAKEYPIPENCNNYSSEGTKYSMQVEASVDAPLKQVEAFYSEQLIAKGYKLATKVTDKTSVYQGKDKQIELTLSPNAGTTSIAMVILDEAAAKRDSMIAPAGQALLLLGNMSDANIEVTLAGKTHNVKPSMGADPKEATRVPVAPGKIKIAIKGGSGKITNLEKEVTAGATWGVIYDNDFQDVMRMY